MNAEGAPAQWPSLPTTLWNHAAVAIESVPSYRMFVFGGQKSEFSYSDHVAILDTGRMSWGSAVYAAGSGTPGAREDCSVTYDPKTCNIIHFGGWKQGWLVTVQTMANLKQMSDGKIVWRAGVSKSQMVDATDPKNPPFTGEYERLTRESLDEILADLETTIETRRAAAQAAP